MFNVSIESFTWYMKHFVDVMGLSAEKKKIYKFCWFNIIELCSIFHNPDVQLDFKTVVASVSENLESVSHMRNDIASCVTLFGSFLHLHIHDR